VVLLWKYGCSLSWPLVQGGGIWLLSSFGCFISGEIPPCARWVGLRVCLRCGSEEKNLHQDSNPLFYSNLSRTQVTSYLSKVKQCQSFSCRILKHTCIIRKLCYKSISHQSGWGSDKWIWSPSLSTHMSCAHITRKCSDHFVLNITSTK